MKLLLKRKIWFFILGVLIVSCSGVDEYLDAAYHGSIRVEDKRFVDESDREIIFNGINVVNKNFADNFLPQIDKSVLIKFNKWGINLVRLGINWSALEPEPLKYDRDYLEQVGIIVEFIGSYGIYVMLDMHQDLYGQKFDNGAPEWATLDDDLPHITGDVWSDSYLISPAVQRSFDSFWANREVSGGIGLQDHYAKAWAQVAEYFSGNEMVIGYDIMNEPFIGSAAKDIFNKLVEGLALLYFEETGLELTEEEAINMWSDQDKRSEILNLVDDPEIYAAWLKPAESIHQEFDIEKLQPFYQRVANAIREKDDDGILFLEHGYFSNLGMSTKISRVMRPDGFTDTQCAYSPHAYDLVVDTRASANPGYERLGLIYNRLSEAKTELNMPVLVGEWGAFYGGQNEDMISAAAFNMNQLDNRGFSHAYWSYFDGLEMQPYFYNSIIRPVLRVVSGQVLGYGFNDEGNYELSWEEDSSSRFSAIIFIPADYQINTIQCSIVANPEVSFFNQEEGSFMYVNSSGSGGIRKLIITFH